MGLRPLEILLFNSEDPLLTSEVYTRQTLTSKVEPLVEWVNNAFNKRKNLIQGTRLTVANKHPSKQQIWDVELKLFFIILDQYMHSGPTLCVD